MHRRCPDHRHEQDQAHQRSPGDASNRIVRFVQARAGRQSTGLPAPTARRAPHRCDRCGGLIVRVGLRTNTRKADSAQPAPSIRPTIAIVAAAWTAMVAARVRSLVTRSNAEMAMG